MAANCAGRVTLKGIHSILMVLIFCIITNFQVQGQSISPGVMGAGGVKYTSNIPFIDMSMGEVAVSTISQQEIIITQGFLQPIRVEQPCAQPTITYYPNPVVDQMVIQAVDCSLQIGYVEAVDLFGKVALTAPVFENTLDLRSIGVGVYILRIFSPADQVIGTIKIIKVTA